MSNAHPFMLRCTSCRAKNRIPVANAGLAARCGKCGTPLAIEALQSRQAVMVSDATFEKAVLHSPLPVLLYAWAPWCSTCQATGPLIDQFAREAAGRVRVGKLNIDANPGIATRFSIMSVPFLYIFDGGALKESLPGGMPLHELMMTMAKYI